MDFAAIDVETANADMSSICAVGIAKFKDGAFTEEWYSIINPQDYFDDINVSIHGINENMAKSAPTYGQVVTTINHTLRDLVTVTHTQFDRVAIHQTSRRFGVAEPACKWLDSARVARRTWAHCARSGYGLVEVCKLLGYKFQHHNALEDAKAAGHIIISAMRETDLDIEGWLARVRQPIDPSMGNSGTAIRREGNPDGALFGEVVVFTGALAMPRREAADLAASAGCTVNPDVTKKTTLLVVGDTDLARLAGHKKSSKHRKAEKLVANGFPIRIIRETDFHQLLATTD
jgi:DNA polymerase-3 subunit epsilon